MALVNNINLYSSNNQLVPCEGPRAAHFSMDFSAAANYSVDFSLQQAQGQLSMVQSMYIDNSANTAALTVVVIGSGQTIVVKANTQGYYPVLCPNPPKFSFASTGNAVVTIDLLNFPVSGCNWATA